MKLARVYSVPTFRFSTFRHRLARAVLYGGSWDGLIIEPPENTLDALDALENFRIISKRKEGKQETGSEQVNRNDRNKK